MKLRSSLLRAVRLDSVPCIGLSQRLPFSFSLSLISCILMHFMAVCRSFVSAVLGFYLLVGIGLALVGHVRNTDV